MGVSRFGHFLILLLLLPLWSLGQAEGKITINFEGESYAEALSKLDRLADRQLSYNPQILPSGSVPRQSYTSRDAEDILQDILRNSYQLKNIGNYLVIQKAPASRTKTTYQIKGGIRDASTGEELQDVSIYEINTLKSTLSDEKGGFDIVAESEFEEATFVISKRFYQDTVIRVTKPEDLGAPIVLKPEKEAKAGLMIRERARTFSSGLAGFFTSIKLRKNAQNVNFTDNRFFQVSLVPSLGTNRKMSSQITNKLSLNLIAGYAYGVKGAEIGGFYNIDREEVRGVQIGGFGNTVGGEVHGLQMGGFINTTKDYVNGAQIGGFFNLASDSVNGFQAAGFTNITRDMSGFQVAGFNNHTKEVSGVQISGFINTTGKMDGLQLTGFINIAKEVRGLQLSVINIADTVASGIPFGLVNVVKKNGFISPAIESDDFTPYQLAIRTGIDNFYTVISGGISPSHFWSYGIGFGSQLYMTKNKLVFFNPELRWINLSNRKPFRNERNMLFKIQPKLGLRLFKDLTVSGGPAINFYISNELNESGIPEIDIANDPIVDKLPGSYRYQVWLGYAISIGF